MAFMSILVAGGIFLIVWLSVSAFLGIVGLILFMTGLIPYHRSPVGSRKTAPYIRMVIGLILLVVALFGLCILFPLRIFAACLASLAGIVVLCFAVPKRVRLKNEDNHGGSPAAIVIGIALIAVSVIYMTFSGIALVLTIIKAIIAS